ncbi:hypothetical protein [Pseudomonas sp. 2FE]|uniref:hypothetical protein n=1 Tax=Pseudomonas sp. 2FE TaxID=2502190 RepID=UPI0010F51E93|nr:hypothetical protein [Pseudomonas sp. 2FE]
MANQVIPLNPEDQTVLIRAALALPEQQLREEIERTITWGPGLQMGEFVYAIPRKALPTSAWNALLELEDWGIARRSADPDLGEILLADKALFELVIKAIRLLLEGIVKLLTGQAPEPALTGTLEPSPALRRRHRYQRGNEIDSPELG